MRIALVGDIALFGRYSVDNGGVFKYFDAMAEYLGGFDCVVGNLETPFGRDLRAKGAKSAYIKADPDNVELLKYLNIGVVNLANNHVFDYGMEGYRSTVDVLDMAGINWFGLEDRQFAITDDACVAFHGYCSYNTNPLGISRDGRAGVNALNVATVERRMRANHDRGYLNVISIHSGQEHVNFPSRDDILMARRFAGICPYVYYGHHPHVLQGLEKVSGSIIAYSLGNFCFDDVYTSKSMEPLIRQSENNRQGAILELEVRGSELRAHRVTPLFAGRERMEVGSEKILERLAEYSDALEQADEEYEARRKAIIDSYLGRRKQSRDLHWYLKRLNFNSVEILLRARYNSNQYRKNVSVYLGR